MTATSLVEVLRARAAFASQSGTNEHGLAPEPRQGGIFPGMINVRNSHEVLTALGPDAVAALGKSVVATRADLAEYRGKVPRLAARHTKRGMLNWVHDQFFANLVAAFDADVKQISVRDQEPTREIYVGDTFRWRFKKHDGKDLVSSYPTSGYLGFAVQDPPQLIQEIRLIGGYRWDPELERIGVGVISARDGRSNVLWAVELDEAASAGGIDFTPRQPSGGALPSLPEIAIGVAMEQLGRDRSDQA